MRYEEEDGDILIALTGDSLVTRRLSAHREARYLELARILRDADATLTNGETLFHNYEGSPIADSGPFGTYAACDPRVIADLRWLGIDMVATANNHCVDYGEIGVVTNLTNLDAYDMPHAGTGRNLSEAVAPAYLDTAKGSVALIAVTLTMPPGDHRAGDPRGIVKGRPGANVLRHTVSYVAPGESFEALRQVGRALASRREFRESGGALELFGRTFELGDTFQRRALLNEVDLERNLQSIRGARRLADWVIVSLHHHEAGGSPDEPSHIAEAFARRCIDAGADLVFGHGPHRDRGIEIYRGKPIFYSLGNFILHNDLIKWEPSDLFARFGLPPEATTADVYDVRADRRIVSAEEADRELQGFVATVQFRARALETVTLYPIDLGVGSASRSQRGRPLLAEGELARTVLGRLRVLSEPYGTDVELLDDRGVVRLRPLDDEPMTSTISTARGDG